MCCSNAAWMREEVPDHKFDFIDVTEFRSKSFFTRLRYVWVYILVIKSVVVYIADGYTAIALLASNRWSGSIIQDPDAVLIPLKISKWIFTGCIIFSYLLLLWEARKARAIIKSRDISYAFTNVMANNYYSLKSYDHFCFFCQINNSKKKKDEFAFFIFFTFKGWKRLVLADGPRQVINALTLYSFAKAKDFSTDPGTYFTSDFLKDGVLLTMLFTVIVWGGSAILLIIAAVMYVPLLCYIRGNLKEYCCHKIDKRIAELMKRKARKRLAKEAALARKEAAGDFSHLKDKKGNMTAAPLPQPTLPNMGIDEEYMFDDGKSDFGGSVVSRGFRGPPGAGYPYGPPPPPLGAGGFGPGFRPDSPSIAQWQAGQGGYGMGMGGIPRPGTPGQRNPYPYAASDSDSLVQGTHGYGASVGSMEPLTKKLAMDRDESGSAWGGSNVGRGGEKPGQGPGTFYGVHRPNESGSTLNRAPSYRSDWSGYNGGSVDKETAAAYDNLSQPPYYTSQFNNSNGGGGGAGRGGGQPPQAPPLSRQQSSPTAAIPYQPPSRQQLLDRTKGRDSVTGLSETGDQTYWRDSTATGFTRDDDKDMTGMYDQAGGRPAGGAAPGGGYWANGGGGGGAGGHGGYR